MVTFLKEKKHFKKLAKIIFYISLCIQLFLVQNLSLLEPWQTAYADLDNISSTESATSELVSASVSAEATPSPLDEIAKRINEDPDYNKNIEENFSKISMGLTFSIMGISLLISLISAFLSDKSGCVWPSDIVMNVAGLVQSIGDIIEFFMSYNKLKSLADNLKDLESKSSSTNLQLKAFDYYLAKEELQKSLIELRIKFLITSMALNYLGATLAIYEISYSAGGPCPLEVVLSKFSIGILSGKGSKSVSNAGEDGDLASYSRISKDNALTEGAAKNVDGDPIHLELNDTHLNSTNKGSKDLTADLTAVETPAGVRPPNRPPPKDHVLNNLYDQRLSLEGRLAKNDLSQVERINLENSLYKIKQKQTQREVDLSVLHTAKKNDTVIMTRGLNPDSLPIIADGGATKGMHIKAKSCEIPVCKGFIPADPMWGKAGTSKKARIMSADEITELKKSGKYNQMEDMNFYVRETENTLTHGHAVKVPLEDGDSYVVIVRDPANPGTERLEKVLKPDFDPKIHKHLDVLADTQTRKPITADLDLFAVGPRKGVWDVEGGFNADNINPDDYGKMHKVEERVMQSVNDEMEVYSTVHDPNVNRRGQNIVHHGPDNRFGLNPVEPPMAIYTPDGSKIEFRTEDYTVTVGSKKTIDYQKFEMDLKARFRELRSRGYDVRANPNWQLPTKNSAGWGNPNARPMTRENYLLLKGWGGEDLISPDMDIPTEWHSSPGTVLFRGRPTEGQPSSEILMPTGT